MNVTTITGYHTSRDYALLARLMRESSIICTAQNPHAAELREGASTRYFNDGGRETFIVGSPGIGYVHAWSEEQFAEQCAKSEIAFIAPLPRGPVNPALLPCPFCGEEAESDAKQFYRHYQTGKPGEAVAVYCLHCTAQISVCREDVPEITDDEVRAMWNRRTPDREARHEAMNREQERELRAQQLIHTPSKVLPAIPGFYWWRKSPADSWEIVPVKEQLGDGLYSVEIGTGAVTWFGSWRDYQPVGEWLYMHPPAQPANPVQLCNHGVPVDRPCYRCGASDQRDIANALKGN